MRMKEDTKYDNIYLSDQEDIRKVTKRLMKRFQKLTTIVNRQTKPCSATTETNINDDHDNIVNVSVVDLDL